MGHKEHLISKSTTIGYVEGNSMSSFTTDHFSGDNFRSDKSGFWWDDKMWKRTTDVGLRWWRTAVEWWAFEKEDGVIDFGGLDDLCREAEKNGVGQVFTFYFDNTYLRCFGGYREITGVTQGNPAIVTCPNHGFAEGDKISIQKVGGMTELNNKDYLVLSPSANSFSLQDEDGNNIDSTAFGAYTSGGWVAHQRSFNARFCNRHIEDINLGADSKIIRFFREFLNRFGNTVKFITVYNEPDIGGNVQGKALDPDTGRELSGGFDLVQFYDRIYNALSRECQAYENRNPGSKIYLGAPCLTNTNGYTQSGFLMDKLLDSGFYNDDRFFLNFHNYPRNTQVNFSFPCEAFFRDVYTFNQKLVERGITKTIPIIVTETGHTTSILGAGINPEMQAQLSTRNFLTHLWLSKEFPQTPHVVTCNFELYAKLPGLRNLAPYGIATSNYDSSYGPYDFTDSVLPFYNGKDNEINRSTLQDKPFSTFLKEAWTKWFGLELDKLVIMDINDDVYYRSDDVKTDTLLGYEVDLRGCSETIKTNIPPLGGQTAATLGLTETITISLGTTDYTINLVTADTIATIESKFQTAFGSDAFCVFLNNSEIYIRPRSNQPQPFSISASDTMKQLLGFWGLSKTDDWSYSQKIPIYERGSHARLYHDLDGLYTEEVYETVRFIGTPEAVGSTGAGANGRWTKAGARDPIWNSTWYFFLKDAKRGNQLTCIAYRWKHWHHGRGDTSNAPEPDGKATRVVESADIKALAETLYPARTFVNVSATAPAGQEAEYTTPQRVPLNPAMRAYKLFEA